MIENRKEKLKKKTNLIINFISIYLFISYHIVRREKKKTRF